MQDKKVGQTQVLAKGGFLNELAMLHDCFNVCTSIVSSYRAVVCVLSRKDFHANVAPLMQKAIVERMAILKKVPLLRGIVRESGSATGGGGTGERRGSSIGNRRKSSVTGKRRSSSSGNPASGSKGQPKQRKRRNSLSLVFEEEQGPGRWWIAEAGIVR